MKKSLIFFAGMFLLASCDSKDTCLDQGGSFDYLTEKCIVSLSGSEIKTSDTDVAIGDLTTKKITYSSIQTEMLAVKLCKSKSVALAIEKDNDVEVAYCVIDDSKVDAWKYFSENNN